MFETLEHKGEVGVKGTAYSQEKAFGETAKAMFGVMADISKIRPEQEFEVKASAENAEELLVEWLNELLYVSSVNNALFCEFTVEIEQRNGEFFLSGKALGEKIDFERHSLYIEVKAASYSGLKVEETDGKVSAQCLLDI